MARVTRLTSESDVLPPCLRMWQDARPLTMYRGLPCKGLPLPPFPRYESRTPERTR